MKLETRRLSICTCGYPLLKPEFPVGTEYDVGRFLTTDVIFTCGGCGQEFKVTAIEVKNALGQREGMIPLEIFFEPGESLDGFLQILAAKFRTDQ